MNKPIIAAAVVMAAVIMGGGYALAANDTTAASVHKAASTNGDALYYLVSQNVSVPAHSAGSQAKRCPSGYYPVGGGPSSSNQQWTIGWSDADRSTSSEPYPNEWTVELFNQTSSEQTFKVFVVCSTARSVTVEPGY